MDSLDSGLMKHVKGLNSSVRFQRKHRAGIDAIATKTFDWSECTHCVVAVDIVERQDSTTGL